MRRFHFKDLETVNEWRLAHGLQAAAVDEVPAVGFIVEGVAAGFLLRTESRAVAMLDAFVTNPSAPVRVRHGAVDALARRVCLEAKARGFRRIGGFTRSHGILAVAKRLGFSIGDSYRGIGKEL